MGKADLHIHTSVSDGVASVSDVLEHIVNHTDLDVIAITDHDEIRGALEARELAARLDLPVGVIVGCEITTLQGHLLALFVERPIRMLMSLEATIDEVHNQGGTCIVPHPLSWLTTSVGAGKLKQLADNHSSGVFLDGLETISATFAGRVAHDRVKVLNRQKLRLAEVGNSDAHNLRTIGVAYTKFEGRSIEDFRQALLIGQTSAGGDFASVWDQLHGLPTILTKSLVVHPFQKLGRVLGSVRDR